MRLGRKIPTRRAPWGKVNRDGGTFHHLAHHCADVAACFEAIAALPVVRARMDQAAGKYLSSAAISRLAVLAFLHDAGKLHPGFQAKGWPNGMWRKPLHGHVREGAAIFRRDAPEAIARNLQLAALIDWGVDEHLLFAALAHHGRPFKPDTAARQRWETVPALYDPVAASAKIGDAIHRWFPEAFAEEHGKLPSTPGFQHLFCGLVSLADWLGSERRIFDFVSALDADYMDKARQKATKAVADIGLDVGTLRTLIAGRAGFAAITGFGRPRPQQQLVGQFPLEEQLLIFEAETGSGKTEAALWRFARLFEAGLVDSLYFALPRRRGGNPHPPRRRGRARRLRRAGRRPLRRQDQRRDAARPLVARDRRERGGDAGIGRRRAHLQDRRYRVSL